MRSENSQPVIFLVGMNAKMREIAETRQDLPDLIRYLVEYMTFAVDRTLAKMPVEQQKYAVHTPELLISFLASELESLKLKLSHAELNLVTMDDREERLFLVLQDRVGELFSQIDYFAEVARSLTDNEAFLNRFEELMRVMGMQSQYIVSDEEAVDRDELIVLEDSSESETVVQAVLRRGQVIYDTAPTGLYGQPKKKGRWSLQS